MFLHSSSSIGPQLAQIAIARPALQRRDFLSNSKYRYRPLAQPDVADCWPCVVTTDNFYTSHALATSLLEHGIYLVGTIRTNQHGFPQELKTDAKQFEKHGGRGDTRYVRQGDLLLQQWKDRRVVNVLSTVHRGHTYGMVTRNTKVDGQHVQLHVRQPRCIADYNHWMGGVNTFDQLAATHRILRKVRKYWETLLLDLIDSVTINCFLYFSMWCQQHPGTIERRRNMRHSDFRANLIRQLAGIALNEPPPRRRRRGPPVDEQPAADILHLPGHRDQKKNCHFCYLTEHRQRQCVTYCRTCDVHLHVGPRDCFAQYHQMFLRITSGTSLGKQNTPFGFPTSIICVVYAPMCCIRERERENHSLKRFDQQFGQHFSDGLCANFDF